MKKWLTISLFYFMVFCSFAQSVTEEVTEESSEYIGYFSDNAKWAMTYVFSIAVIIIVLRTFRGKPEV